MVRFGKILRFRINEVYKLTKVDNSNQEIVFWVLFIQTIQLTS